MSADEETAPNNPIASRELHIPLYLLYFPQPRLPGHPAGSRELAA
jgi:hypothetical protein